MLTEIRKNADGLNAQCNCVVYAVDGMYNLYHVKKSHENTGSFSSIYIDSYCLVAKTGSKNSNAINITRH